MSDYKSSYSLETFHCFKPYFKATPSPFYSVLAK